MAFAGAIATCIMLVLLLRVPFAGGQSTEATSEVEHILSESGCGAFAGLVAATTGAGEAFRAQIAGGDGLTIFCPDDDAVAAFGAGRFSNLSADCQVELLLYHGVPKLYSEEALGGGVIIDSDVATLAASSAGWWRRLLAYKCKSKAHRLALGHVLASRITPCLNKPFELDGA
jgi:hypothetical protein